MFLPCIGVLMTVKSGIENNEVMTLHGPPTVVSKLEYMYLSLANCSHFSDLFAHVVHKMDLLKEKVQE